MVTSIYLSSTQGRSGKSAVALGLVDLLGRRAGRVGVFRPVVHDHDHPDRLLSLLVSRLPLERPERVVSQWYGVAYQDVHDDEDRSMELILERFHAMSEDLDIVLVVGSDFTGVATPTELSFNYRVAANLDAPVLLIVGSAGHSVDDVVTATSLGVAEATAQHARVLGLVANRADPGALTSIREALAARFTSLPVSVLPNDDVLCAPTVRDLMAAGEGRQIHGSEELLDREALGLVIAAMTLPHVLDRLSPDTVVVTPGDREDVALGVLLAHRSTTFPSISGMVLNGGFSLSPQVAKLINGLEIDLPVIAVGTDTTETARRLAAAPGQITPTTHRKLQLAHELVEQHIDLEPLLQRLDLGETHVLTPLMFEHRLIERAREADTHIVLPEGEEDRILLSAGQLLSRNVARLTLLGDPDRIRARALQLGVDLGAATLHPTDHPELRERFATAYTALRAAKGMTMDIALETVTDPAFFGTLMVHEGLADGMVSGCITTTANTIRPALQIIRTVPGMSVVSSVFFMCLADRVLVYGDCAVNPDPSAEQLADIAISSAATAAQFGIEPKIAMLSYSTGSSGTGADVEKVRTATELVRVRAPELSVEGPIQYDAAVDLAVAQTKLKESRVAGHANVLIFPDLNTGNNTYKAVQRSASAVAIGPVLQGLNKPVNDLSRGALIRDIVNTVAITAIQAGASA